MELVKIADCEKTSYMDLLLIADEQRSMVEKYLHRGEMFALRDGGVKAICVVTQEKPGVYEIKNIVTVPRYQRRGYGRRLVSLIADCYKDYGSELLVGTGDCPSILRFYERCGFEKAYIVRNFFVENYDRPLFEDGKQLVDMVYLRRAL